MDSTKSSLRSNRERNPYCHKRTVASGPGAASSPWPNIEYAPGAYWDFFDHYVELTELLLSEALSNCGFTIEKQVGRFLPYTMSHGRQYPVWMLRLYLITPFVWRMFGRQFLVIGQKPRNRKRFHHAVLIKVCRGDC